MGFVAWYNPERYRAVARTPARKDKPGCPRSKVSFCIALPGSSMRPHGRPTASKAIGQVRPASQSSSGGAALLLRPATRRGFAPPFTRWSRPRKARSFRRLISAAYTTSTRGRRDGIRVVSNPFREDSLRRVGKNGPFVLVGEPIAAVNWCKGDAAQQRKLKAPQVSTPMEFLVRTHGHIGMIRSAAQQDVSSSSCPFP